MARNIVLNIATDSVESERPLEGLARRPERRGAWAESMFTKHYFDQIFPLFPEQLRPKGRRTFKAYDGLNNLFNLGYEILSWKVHQVLIKTNLEPYLGFLHST
jgi:CRISPR/Cas system-associated endonuclease Cas1